jgi:hypothetical protein
MTRGQGVSRWAVVWLLVAEVMAYLVGGTLAALAFGWDPTLVGLVCALIVALAGTFWVVRR